MNSRLFFKQLAFIILISFALSVSAASQSEPESLPTPVGKVVWVNGGFHAISSNKEDRKLQKASIIFLHDTLVTDKNAQAQIVFSDNTMMTFKPETQFYIDQYQFNPKTKKQSVGKYVMRLIEGGFRTITGLIAKKNPPDYQVNTPVATIGVRGTDYVVYYKKGKGDLYIGYYEGKPCIRGGKKQAELCLDKNNPFGYVNKESVVPVPVMERPDVFNEKLTIISSLPPNFNLPPSNNGIINNSFCITK